jgi:hypothetical protein
MPKFQKDARAGRGANINKYINCEGREGREGKIPNSNVQIAMTNFQRGTRASRGIFGHWNLEFGIWDLRFGIWDLGFFSSRPSYPSRLICLIVCLIDLVPASPGWDTRYATTRDNSC